LAVLADNVSATTNKAHNTATRMIGFLSGFRLPAPG